MIAKTAYGDKEALETIRSSLRERDSLPMVWDAFSGFGGIPIAAQKLGLRAIVNDLNPVAAMLTRAAADIPARFAGQPPTHPGKLKRTVYSGAQGLAEDVQFYGEWLENQALKLLADAYPQTESGEIPFAWIWVRTVKCPNPACSCHVPLGSSYILSKSKNAAYWAEPVNENGELHFEIHEGECPKDKESNKVSGNGARFRCPVCGEITTDEYIKKISPTNITRACGLPTPNTMFVRVWQSSQSRQSPHDGADLLKRHLARRLPGVAWNMHDAHGSSLSLPMRRSVACPHPRRRATRRRRAGRRAPNALGRLVRGTPCRGASRNRRPPRSLSFRAIAPFHRR